MQHLLELEACCWVQANKWLVQNDELWLVEQGGNQNQLLLHTVRVAANSICQGVGDAQAVGQRSNALDAVLRRNAKDVADVIEVLDTAHELVNVWVIRHVSDDLL